MDSSNSILNLSEDISSCWNPARFSIARSPQYIGTLINKSSFLSKKVSCLDMLIKKPFGNVRIPYSDRSLSEIVDRCLEYEKNINPNWNHYYTYLTIDQRFVKAGFTHRREGIHFDGMQGVAYPKKMPVCHSYIVCNTLPTRFYLHKFLAIHLSEARNNWFFELEQQAQKKIVFYPKPFDIFLMTAYQVHEAVPAINFTTRTFVRVEFTLKKYNRIGNTVNPLMGIDWEFIDREIPVHLRNQTIVLRKRVN